MVVMIQTQSKMSASSHARLYIEITDQSGAWSQFCRNKPANGNESERNLTKCAAIFANGSVTQVAQTRIEKYQRGKFAQSP